MNKEDKGHLKVKIKDLITKYQVEVTEIETLTQPIKPENSLGRISRMDAINNKSVLEAALRTKKSKLNKLRVALENIDENNFGICVSCKNNIQAARMMFMPESTKCVRCAAR